MHESNVCFAADVIIFVVVVVVVVVVILGKF